METRCPDCTKRLRLPDTYSNQRVRCRNCGTVFRPSSVENHANVEVAELVDEAVAAPVQPRPTPRPARTPSRPTARSRGGGGFGIAIIIGLMLFSRLPGLLKNFGDRDRNKPVPVEVREEDLQRLREVIKEVPEPPGERIDEFADPEAVERARRRNKDLRQDRDPEEN